MSFHLSFGHGSDIPQFFFVKKPENKMKIHTIFLFSLVFFSASVRLCEKTQYSTATFHGSALSFSTSLTAAQRTTFRDDFLL